MKLALAFVATLGLAMMAPADVIFDNGGPDGSNGLSAGDFSFGYREAADDFVLGDEYSSWYVQDLHFEYIWYNGGGMGYVTQAEVLFYEDTGAGPALTPLGISPGISPIVNEQMTGNFYFSRESIAYDIEFDNVELQSGTTYWVSVTLQDCPENGFWLTSAAGAGNLFGQEAYVSMPDIGYPKWTTSTSAFGTPYDLTFQLTGVGVPAPGALALLGLAGLVSRRRR
jgi:MYXO-CTERM domain-containing protein